MKRLLRGLTVFLFGALVGALALFAVEHRHELGEQWALYDMGRSETYAQAEGRLAWFEVEPRRDQKLALVVSSWGTGRPTVDEWLARYVSSSRASDELREALARQLARRPELLPRWAHYWAWRCPLGPEAEMESVARYLGTLAGAHPPRPITWREVLDAQALLTLAGSPDEARQVTAEAWQGPFRRWQENADKATRPAIERPRLPLPDWAGPPPERP